MSYSNNRNAEPDTIVELERCWREQVYRQPTKDNVRSYNDSVTKLTDAAINGTSL